MKFLRHLVAVVLVVAVIVGLGMLWAHVSGGGTGAGSGLRRLPAGDAGFHLANTRDLISTSVIEAVLAAIVIAVSVVRRRYRRTRHTAVSRA